MSDQDTSRELGKVLREKRKEQTESGRTGRSGGLR